MVHEGIGACKAMGAELVQPYLISLLAETYLGTVEVMEGVSLLNGALHECERRGEHLWEAELLRLLGRLQLSSGQDNEAEISFQRGLDIAIRQGAKLFQTRVETEMDAALGARSPGRRAAN
jgi:hypothetical protein